MTCIRDIMTEDALEREFDSIRVLFKDLKTEEKPLRIHWGTKSAFDSMEAQQSSQIEEVAKEIERSMNISMARHWKDVGDWKWYWLGREEAYRDVLGLIQGNEDKRLNARIDIPANIQIAKEMGFLP